MKGVVVFSLLVGETRKEAEMDKQERLERIEKVLDLLYEAEEVFFTWQDDDAKAEDLMESGELYGSESFSPLLGWMEDLKREIDRKN